MTAILQHPQLRSAYVLPPRFPTIRRSRVPTTEEEVEQARRQGRDLSAAAAPAMLQAHFRHLSHSLSIPVLALLPSPQQQTFDPGAPYRRTVKEFLARAMMRFTSSDIPAALMAKWRGDTLLVSYPTWFMDVQRLPSYALMRQAQQISKNGFASLRDLVQIAAQTDQAQWRELCAAAPLLYFMQDAHDLLQLCAAYPVLLREDGLNLTGDAQSAARNATPLYRFPMLFDGVTSLRVQTIERVSAVAKKREMQVQYRGADKKWKPLVGYYQQLPTKP